MSESCVVVIDETGASYTLSPESLSALRDLAARMDHSMAASATVLLEQRLAGRTPDPAELATQRSTHTARLDQPVAINRPSETSAARDGDA